MHELSITPLSTYHSSAKSVNWGRSASWVLQLHHPVAIVTVLWQSVGDLRETIVESSVMV
jgi:hypothetical protein